MNFSEAQNFEINEEDRNTLKSFSDSKEWEIQKKVVESYILKLTANLLIGTESYQGSSVDELKELRGFVRYWNIKIKRLIEKKDEDET